MLDECVGRYEWTFICVNVPILCVYVCLCMFSCMCVHIVSTHVLACVYLRVCVANSPLDQGKD